VNSSKGESIFTNASKYSSRGRALEGDKKCGCCACAGGRGKKKERTTGNSGEGMSVSISDKKKRGGLKGKRS